ncbi:MAG: hypothetical protein IPK82_29815 [Polyangiaceae bacterium]|nr:hypothetical protein [Polyangiaceae bacterium]
MRLKRQVDVVYRIASLIKDVALMKAAVNTWATVDSGFQAVQSARLQVQVWEAVGRGTRGNVGDQFADEWESGAGGKAWVDNQGTKEQKGKLDAYAFDWNTASKKKATLRSAAPDSSKGFAGLHGAGGQLAAGQTLTITSDAGTSYTTPPLTLPIPPKGAKIAGGAGSDTFTYADGARVWVNIDSGTTVEINLSQTTTKRPKVESASVASLVGTTSALIGKTLTITTDTGSAVSITFSAADCASAAALSAALTTTFPALTVSLDSTSNKFTFESKKYGPGASVTVTSGDAATALGLSTTKQPGASLAEVQAYVQSQINAVFSGSTTLDSGAKKLTIQSPTTGTTSTINLSESTAGLLSDLGLTTASATGTASKSAAKDITAADIVALLKQASTQVTTNGVTSAKYATDDMDFSVDGTQVLITSKKEGDGSDIRVSGSMAAPLGFVGETNGDVEWDHVYDDGRRQLDSFNKLDQEMLRMPDQLAALARPATVLVKNAAGAVSKLLSISKALGKMSPLKLPQAKGAIGLVAKGGISLGTPDRLVGTGSKGIVFIADGQGGAPDHAKFAAFEEMINRITSADPSTFFGAFASKDDKTLFKDRLKGVNPFKQPDKTNQAAVGFRVFSDSTVDLVSRNTANLLALGRGKNADDTITGVGVARVAASYATEIVGREKVVIRTAKDDKSNIEVIGKTITLGVWDAVDDIDRFGPTDKGNIAKGTGTAGWDDTTSKNLQQTSQIFAHAADQATIVVGDYMVQLRGKTSCQIAKDEAQRVVDELTETKTKASVNKATWTTKEETANAKVELLERAANSSLSEAMANLFGGDDIDTLVEEWRDKANEAHSKVRHYTRAFNRASRRLTQAQTTLASVYEDEGIIISVRDTTDGKKSPNYMAKIGKPAISVSQKGITITTMADKKLTDPADDTSQPGARITLNEDGISIMVGGKAGYRITKDYKLQLTDGTNKAEVSNTGWNFQTNAQIQFSAAQKITLG